MTLKAIRTWIVIADGSRARVLLNEGPGKGLEPVLDHDFAASHPRTSEIGTERPGRVHESSGVGTRHALEPGVDWHTEEKRKFEKEVAKVLNEAAQNGRFDRLVLVSPAKSLGQFRKSLSKLAQARIVGELAKDLDPDFRARSARAPRRRRGAVAQIPSRRNRRQRRFAFNFKYIELFA